MKGLLARVLLVISLCVCTRVATIQAQIVVGFNGEDQTVSEGGGGILQVTCIGSNVNNIDVTATPMTLAQFTESRGGDLGSLPQDVQDAIAAIQDPAEYDPDPSGIRDFNNTPIAFTFAPGGDTFFNIQSGDIIFDDDVTEASEGFIIVLTITSGNMDGSNNVELNNQFDGILVVEIRNNDRITLGFNELSYALSEGDGGTADNIRIVNQSNVLSEIDIPLQLMINTTAEEGEDYNLTTMYTFTPDDTEIIIPITVFDDVVTEGDEVLVLSLTTELSSAIVSVDPASATVTIRDDDVVSVSFSATSLSANEGEIVTLTVQLTCEAAVDITVQLNTADGTATAPGDYTALVDEEVVIEIGSSSATATVMINTDNEREDDETFTVIMTSSSSLVRVAPGGDQATVTIWDAGDCSNPDELTNGMIVFFNGTREGSVITFQCDPGLSLVGNRVFQCRSGWWTVLPQDVSCTVDATVSASPGPTRTCQQELSTAAVAAITAIPCVVVSLTIGALLGALLHRVLTRAGNKPQSQSQEEVPVPLYEVIDNMTSREVESAAIELKPNEAYGPVRQQSTDVNQT